MTGCDDSDDSEADVGIEGSRQASRGIETDLIASVENCSSIELMNNLNATAWADGARTTMPANSIQTHEAEI
ncbi:hypothetical protein BCON_0380g00100 [Botryotinia convoluta]|uniref:Uncharacterized protein n=1 Tax=Botryotinia convoluta TaxID=54673 RepID=A0A4Z1HDZ8_9HELO|nr:hypothetical protein BCON_0380g00100 [Botryotinia convoluta]